jgi:hypothetical protein
MSVLENLREQSTRDVLPTPMAFDQVQLIEQEGIVNEAMEEVSDAMADLEAITVGVGIECRELELEDVLTTAELEGALDSIKGGAKKVIDKIKELIDKMLSYINKMLDKLKANRDEKFIKGRSELIGVAAKLSGKVTMSAKWSFGEGKDIVEQFEASSKDAKKALDGYIDKIDTVDDGIFRGAEAVEKSRAKSLKNKIYQGLVGGNAPDAPVPSEIAKKFVGRVMTGSETGLGTKSEVSFSEFCNEKGMNFVSKAVEDRRALDNMRKALKKEKAALDKISLPDNAKVGGAQASAGKVINDTIGAIKVFYDVEIAVCKAGMKAIMSRRSDLKKGFKAAVKAAQTNKKGKKK